MRKGGGGMDFITRLNSICRPGEKKRLCEAAFDAEDDALRDVLKKAGPFAKLGEACWRRVV